MRSPAKAGAFPFDSAADRGNLRPRRGRRRHQRAFGGVVLPARQAVRPHPHPRQPRRFRRPRQAQRVHARWPPHHRLRRQPVAAIAATRSTARSPRACCASSASTSRGSRPRSSASFIRRSGCRAACSSTARRSAATCWSPAIRGGERRRGGAPPQRQAAGRVRVGDFRFRRRARRRSSRSTPASAIRWPASRWRKSARSSSAPAIATI